jgi:hypothetical protein
VQTIAVNHHGIAVILNRNPHTLKTGNRGQTVRSLKKIMNLGGSFCDGTEHDTSVGDGFVTRDMNLAS